MFSITSKDLAQRLLTISQQLQKADPKGLVGVELNHFNHTALEFFTNLPFSLNLKTPDVDLNRHIFREPISALKLPVRVTNALIAQKVLMVRDLLWHSPVELMKIPYVGKGAIALIEAAIRREGHTLRTKPWESFLVSLKAPDGSCEVEEVVLWRPALELAKLHFISKTIEIEECSPAQAHQSFQWGLGDPSGDRQRRLQALIEDAPGGQGLPVTRVGVGGHVWRGHLSRPPVFDLQPF